MVSSEEKENSKSKRSKKPTSSNKCGNINTHIQKNLSERNVAKILIDGDSKAVDGVGESTFRTNTQIYGTKTIRGFVNLREVCERANLDIDWDDKVVSNVRVPRWFREMEKGLAEDFGSSTCELRMATILAMYFGREKIPYPIILSNGFHFHVHLDLIRVVPRRRRKRIRIQVDSDEFVEGFRSYGSPEKCCCCGSDYHVKSIITADRSSSVYLCSYCAVEWAEKKKV